MLAGFEDIFKKKKQFKSNFRVLLFPNILRGELAKGQEGRERPYPPAITLNTQGSLTSIGGVAHNPLATVHAASTLGT